MGILPKTNSLALNAARSSEESLWLLTSLVSVVVTPRVPCSAVRAVGGAVGGAVLFTCAGREQYLTICP